MTKEEEINNLTITHNCWDSQHVSWVIIDGRKYELTDKIGIQQYEWMEVTLTYAN